MASYDFFAPFAHVWIKNGAGREWIFDVGRWPTTNVAGDNATMGGPFVTSVSVTVNQGATHDGLTIGIEAPYTEGINLLEQGAFDFRNEVYAQIGYLTGDASLVTELYCGFLNKGGDGLALSADKLSGSITADFLSSRQVNFLKTGQTPKEGGKTARAILEGAARDIGLMLFPLGAAGDKLDALSKAVAGKDKDAEATYYGIDGAVPPIQIIRKILDMASLDWFLGNQETSGGTGYTPAIFCYEKDYPAKLPAQYLLVLRGLFEPSAAVPQYPILDLSFSGGGAMWNEGRRWDPGNKEDPGTAGVRAIVMEKDTGEMLAMCYTGPGQIIRPSDPKGTQVASAAKDDKRKGMQADKAADGKTRVPKHMSVTAPGGQAQNRADQVTLSAATSAADRMAIVVTATTLGLPLVKPGMPIAVVGCSSMINSTYNVRKVTHNYAPGDWRTVLELVKWGTIANSNLVQTPGTGQPMKDAK